MKKEREEDIRYSNKISIYYYRNRNITEQSIINKELRDYRKQMAMIKSESIYKKSPDKRYDMYREKKRKEYEFKKKMEEDKKGI